MKFFIKGTIVMVITPCLILPCIIQIAGGADIERTWLGKFITKIYD